MWYLSSDDVQCLSIGCGILGSGGGGPPAMCKELAIDAWLEGKHLQIYNPYHTRFVILIPSILLCLNTIEWEIFKGLNFYPVAAPGMVC